MNRPDNPHNVAPQNIDPVDGYARALRNEVYGEPISDREWSHARNFWRHPEQMSWLRQQVKAKRGPLNNPELERLRDSI